MPENVMLKISEAVGFPSIFTLRKTCHDYRNFIDDKIPNINLTGIVIYVHPQRIYWCYEISGDKVFILYNNHPDGCVFEHKPHEIFLRDEDFISLFLRDFELFIKHQKSTLEQFHFNSGCLTNEEEFHHFISPILDKTMKILKSRSCPLKVKGFTMSAFRQEHVMSILPFLDANLLKSISMEHTDYEAFENNETVMKLNEIMELPQWRNATNLEIMHLYVTEPVENFFGFAKVAIWKKSVTGNDFLSVKEKFLSPNNQTEEFIIFYEVFFDGQILGDCITDDCGDQHWYYRTENKEKLLTIFKNNLHKKLIVSFIGRSDVPENAVVLA
ncbi:hypothetical protein CRE_12944 [Caenorhabditis remanei]|uniref:DUF38 domain-containing protein n=1 Tax=Caenorhabditis remanei TaxID=31234 RepID=E3N156_CAERE|nr:hypothetical protein CRE_12944 [Caenorhabditis remanei]